MWCRTGSFPSCAELFCAHLFGGCKQLRMFALARLVCYWTFTGELRVRRLPLAFGAIISSCRWHARSLQWRRFQILTVVAAFPRRCPPVRCAVPIPDSPLVIRWRVTGGGVAYAASETAGGIIAARSRN